MKPWEELTDIEKREAIARRLGIKLESDAAGHWVAKTTDTHWWLPKDWPTNDGLAFTEVWPKILHQAPWASLRLEKYKPCVEIGSDIVGETWADAICKAFYEVLPDSNSSDKS